MFFYGNILLWLAVGFLCHCVAKLIVNVSICKKSSRRCLIDWWTAFLHFVRYQLNELSCLCDRHYADTLARFHDLNSNLLWASNVCRFVLLTLYFYCISLCTEEFCWIKPFSRCLLQLFIQILLHLDENDKDKLNTSRLSLSFALLVSQFSYFKEFTRYLNPIAILKSWCLK